MKTIWHVYHSTRGCAGDYVHALVGASENVGIRCRAFVSARYLFNTPHTIKLFFPVTDRMRNRGSRLRFFRGLELATGYGMIILDAWFARPLINIVLTDSYWITYAFFRLCKLLRLPTAVTCLDVIEHSGAFPERRRKILEGADKLIVHTTAAARMLATAIAPAPDRVVLYPFPSASSKQIMQEPAWTQALEEAARLLLGKHTFLFIGYVRRVKGAQVLLDAWTLLSRNGVPDAQLLIAGQWHKECLGMKGQFAALPNVEIRDGRVSDEEFLALIRSAGCVVLPYANYAHSGILFTCANEAAPVIVSDVELFSDLIPDYPFRFRQGDAEDLARALEQVVQAPDETRRQAGARLASRIATLNATLPAKLRECYRALGGG